MQTIIWVIAAGVGLTVAYVFVVRPLAQRHIPGFSALCEKLDPIYARLFGKSKTLVVARSVSTLGYVIGFHDVIVPIVAQLDAVGLGWSAFFDPQTAKMMSASFIVLGHVFSWLRKVTTEPLEAKEDA